MNQLIYEEVVVDFELPVKVTGHNYHLVQPPLKPTKQQGEVEE